MASASYDKKRDSNDSRKLPRTRIADSSVLLAAMVADLQNGRFGLTQGQPEVTPAYSSYCESKSQVLSGVENGFILRLPFAGTTIKFEMFFNLSDPLLTPDFVCLSDEDFCPDIDSLPSLARWGEQRHTVPLSQQIVNVVEELLEAFRRYQLNRLTYQYPTLKAECIGDVSTTDVEICLEIAPSSQALSARLSDPIPSSSSSSKPTWSLHAMCKLPSLPTKTHQYLSNPQDAKGSIYLYWGLPLPASSSGNGPCSSRPSSSRAEIVLLRNETIKDFFNEFGFKTPITDPSDSFAAIATRYIEAFNSFLLKTPQSLERRRQIFELFGEKFPIVHVDRRRWAFASYLIRTAQHCCLLNITFSSLMSNQLPVIELVSAYPVQRFPGATRKTYPVKLPNITCGLDQVKAVEFLDKTETLLSHVVPLFISELVQ